MLALLKRNLFIIVIFIFTILLAFLTFLTFIGKSFIDLSENNLQYLLIANLILLIVFFILIFIDIKNSIKNNDIEISPLIEEYIQPSSIDLRVGTDFRVFENHKYSHIDPKAQQDDLTSLVTATIEEPFVLHPGEFVLGTTFEKVSLSNKVVARLEGKSSLGRIGLLIHSTAGFVDPGFSGFLTLELSNVANLPIKIYPEMKIGQISFYYLNSPSESEYGSEAYGSKYQGQEGPTPSRSHTDFKK